MGYLDNTTQTVDAILTKKGRELLARGENEFKVTKFALGDDEIDYSLWDVTHPNGTSAYGSAIENLPLLEAVPDENQIMRYKLVTLPKDTAKLPVVTLPQSSFTFTRAGVQQGIVPNTANGSDATGGYTIILHNADACDLFVAAGGAVERTVIGKSFNLVSRTTTTTIATQITIIGNDTGGITTIPVTVKANS